MTKCVVCKEYDEPLTDGICADCQLHIMALALVRRCRDVPITTPYEAMLWLQMLKFQAETILKGKE